MRYRCPYCKATLGANPPPRCPACGATMIVPSMRKVSERMVRQRKIEAIWRECEQRKETLKVFRFSARRYPQLYLGMIAVLAVLGAAIFKATDGAVARRRVTPHMRAMRQVDVLAEALGRYRFHVGVYPTMRQGLAALVRNPPMPGWDGPYINLLIPDPWGTPYVYEPATGTNQWPVLLSCGADRTRGTADDILPAPERFDPGSDWTNGWVSAAERGSGVKVLSQGP